MKNLILLIFVSGMISCAGPSKKDIGEAPVEPYQISFDLENLSDNGAPMMSDVIDSLEYIKLEYNPKLPIGSILEDMLPYITNDYIFIYGSHGAGLLQYKRNGEFVRKIGSYGRGPGEYLQLRDFVIDEKQGIIYTIPNWKTVIGKYDYFNGKYLEEIPIVDLNGKQITKYSNNIKNIYTFYDREILVNPSGVRRAKDSKYDVFYTIDLISGHIINHKESKIYGLDNLKIDVKGSPVLASIPNIVWYDSRGRLNFWESLNDTIFIVNPDFTTTPRIIVDFGSYKLDAKTAVTVRASKDFVNMSLLLSRFCESPRYLFFQFAFKERYISSAYDKTTGDQYLLGSISEEEFKINNLFLGIYNDIDGGLSYMWQYDKNMWFTSYSAIEMIDKLTPEHFEEVRSKVKYPERLDKLKEFVSKLDEGDNPVFVIAHLKQ